MQSSGSYPNIVRDADYLGVITTGMTNTQKPITHGFAFEEKQEAKDKAEYRKRRQSLLDALGPVRDEITKVMALLKQQIPGLVIVPEIVEPAVGMGVQYHFALAGKYCVAEIRPSTDDAGVTSLRGPDEHFKFYQYGSYRHDPSNYEYGVAPGDLKDPATAIAAWVSEQLTRAAYGQLVS